MHASPQLSLENSRLADILSWFNEVAVSGLGFVRTKGGEDLVVMRPERVAELDAILSDPAFLQVVEKGVEDVITGHVAEADSSLSLKENLVAPPCDDAMVKRVEEGVDDLLAGRITELRDDQSLEDLR